MFKNEITDLLEDEIVSRYFYENGAIAYTIKNDEQVLKARDILNNKEEYNSILKGTSGAILVTKKNELAITKPDNIQSKRDLEPL
jgi:hypothetical protein